MLPVTPRRTALFALLAVLALETPAMAATVALRTDKAGVQYLGYDAAPGETNDVTIDPFNFNGWFVVRELVAPLNLGEGCIADAAVRCFAPRVGVRVDAGNGDDHVRSVPFWTDSNVWGGSGDDEIVSDGFLHNNVWGGPGRDTIRLAAEHESIGYGGPGDDQLIGSGTFSVELYGEEGDDILTTPNVADVRVLDGGTGDDTISTGERGKYAARSVTGGAGNDVISAPGAPVDAGPGRDTVTGGGGVDRIDTGPGSDTIDVSGDPDAAVGDEVTCGSGKDLVYADGNDTLADDCETRVGEPTDIARTS